MASKPEILNERGEGLTAFAYEPFTVSTAALGLTEATHDVAGEAPAQKAYVSVEDQPIRYTLEGTTPTATVGHEANDGDYVILNTNAEIRAFQMIREGGTDALVKVTYFR